MQHLYTINYFSHTVSISFQNVFTPSFHEFHGKVQIYQTLIWWWTVVNRLLAIPFTPVIRLLFRDQSIELIFVEQLFYWCIVCTIHSMSHTRCNKIMYFDHWMMNAHCLFWIRNYQVQCNFPIPEKPELPMNVVSIKNGTSHEHSTIRKFYYSWHI